MSREKRKINRNTRRFYIFLIAIVVSLIAIGAVLGFFIGKAFAYNDTAVEIASTEIPHTTPSPAPTTNYYDCPLSEELQDYIRNLCEENNIPMDVVIAQIQVESNFKADSISGTNDYGLMQINKINHKQLKKEYGVTDFLDPYQNVLCGIKILSGHYNRFGDLDKALMAYNLGVGGAKKLWKKGIYSTEYVEKIRSAMDALHAPQYASVEKYTVKANDTLSSIAVKYIPSDKYMNKWIKDVMRLNDRTEPIVYWGETIEVLTYEEVR